MYIICLIEHWWWSWLPLVLSAVSIVFFINILAGNLFEYDEFSTTYSEKDFENATRFYLVAKDYTVVATNIVEVMTNIQPAYVHLSIAFEKADHSIFMKELKYKGIFRTDIEEPTLDVGNNVVYLPFKAECSANDAENGKE